jgi:hypothetical protein
MAKTDTKNAKKSKNAGKKGKGGKQGKADSSGGISIVGHPRAAAAVKRSKGFGGLAGFGLAAYLSYKAGVPPEQVGLRALAVGIAGYMVAWACAVTVWRHLVLAEFRHALENGRATLTPAPEKPKDEPAGKPDTGGE